jgi:hypothetical protein
MARAKRHSRLEIATKLTQANDLATQGKLQSEITDRTRSKGDKIAELELENARLRQLVTNCPGMTRRRSLRDRSCGFSIFARLLTRGIGAEREAETWGVAPRSLPCPPVDLAHSLRQLLGMQTAAAFGAAVDQACGTNVALGPAVANALPPCLTASP